MTRRIVPKRIAQPIQPRILRTREAPAYCGADRNKLKKHFARQLARIPWLTREHLMFLSLQTC